MLLLNGLLRSRAPSLTALSVKDLEGHMDTSTCLQSSHSEHISRRPNKDYPGNHSSEPGIGLPLAPSILQAPLGQRPAPTGWSIDYV